jgi:hypothetical protein
MKHKLLMITASLCAAIMIAGQLHESTAFADGCSSTQVDLDGVTCVDAGANPGDPGDSGRDEDDGTPGNSGGNNQPREGDGDHEGQACVPGTTFGDLNFYTTIGNLGSLVDSLVFTLPDGSVVPGNELPGDSCTVISQYVDSCTGSSLGPPTAPIANQDGQFHITECPTSWVTPPNPCDEFTVSTGGVTCVSDFVDHGTFGSEWALRAHAAWPGMELHTRPFPVTLVDWDSVLKVAGLGTSHAAERLGYMPWGGGRENSPTSGDWRDVVLRLEIRPVADWAEVFLENIGLTRLQVGHLYTFQWNLPSHPAAGGGPLSGEVGQLEELEPDMPLYSNWSRAPYMVYCTIEYYEWESTCVGGPGENGEFNCRRNSNGEFTGHREWGWKRHSQTIPIPPTAARVDAPASLLADLNGDGVADAYWGRLSLIRRMDDAGSVTNPQWAHSYSWGAWWYWAVREAQGQIGWPGVPLDP